MNKRGDLERLEADRQFCLSHMRRSGAVVGCLTALAFAIHLLVGLPPLLNTCLLLACLWVPVAFSGAASLVLAWHISRLNHD